MTSDRAGPGLATQLPLSKTNGRGFSDNKLYNVLDLIRVRAVAMCDCPRIGACFAQLGTLSGEEWWGCHVCTVSHGCERDDRSICVGFGERCALFEIIS